MTVPSVRLFPINTQRADTLLDTDNCCLPAVSLGYRDWHPVWIWSIVLHVLAHKLSSTLPVFRSEHSAITHWSRFPQQRGKTAQQLPKVDESEMLHVNWLSKWFCHLLFSLVFKDAGTQCFGYQVLLKVVEAFSAPPPVFFKLPLST